MRSAAQFGARDVEDRDVFFVFDLVDGFVLGALCDPDHMFEIDHLDAHFFLMFAEQILRLIGAIEIFASGIGTGAGVVAANDKVGAAVVFADQTVPNSLAGASHTHGKVEQGHGRG